MRDGHIVGEPMRAYEAGQELLCLDTEGPALHARFQKVWRGLWRGVAAHCQASFLIYIYIYMIIHWAQDGILHDPEIHTVTLPILQSCNYICLVSCVLYSAQLQWCCQCHAIN